MKIQCNCEWGCIICKGVDGETRNAEELLAVLRAAPEIGDYVVIEQEWIEGCWRDTFAMPHEWYKSKTDAEVAALTKHPAACIAEVVRAPSGWTTENHEAAAKHLEGT